MADIEREPCPLCGELAALAARVCPHCHGSALVDVFAERRVDDARQRYQLARAIVGAGVPGLNVTGVQAGFVQAGLPLARGLTRADARRLAQAVSAQGGALREQATTGAGRPATVAAPAQGPSSVNPRRVVVVAGLVAALGAGMYAAGRSWPVAVRSSQSAVARPLPAAFVPTPLTTRQIAERVTPSTVSLRCSHSVGAGFFVTDEMVLTNAHVACEGSLIEAVFPDGRRLAAEVIKKDDWLDLASFRVLGAKATPLALGDAARLQPGDKVVLIGSPQGLDFTVHEGIVSIASRDYLGVLYIQVDANVNPGNSGGPLLDAQGRVVGVVSMTVGKASGLGLALPINYAYTGESSVVPPPEVVESASRWPALLARIDDEEKRQIQDWHEAFTTKLGVLEARGQTPARVLVLGIRRFGASAPERISVPYTVMLGGLPRCGGFATFLSWQSVEQQASKSRQLLWLRRNDLTRGLFLSLAEVHLCAGDRREMGKFELGFRESDPRADRVAINWSGADAGEEE